MQDIDESPHNDRNCHCAGNLGGEFFFADLSLQPPEDGADLNMNSQLPHLIKFGIIWWTEVVLISHCFASSSEMSVYRKIQICY